MKKAVLRFLVLASMLSTTAALAQHNHEMGDMRSMDMDKRRAASAQAKHMAIGTVKNVDAKTGTVTLAHERVTSLNWPAMTMDFKVGNMMLLDKFADGKKVEFEFMQVGKDYVITRVK